MNGIPVSRRWMIGGAAALTASTYLTDVATALVHQVTGKDPDNTAGGTSDAVVATKSIGSKVGQMGWNLTEDGFDNALFAPNFHFINRMKASGYDGAWNNGASLSQYGYPTSAGTQGRDTATFLPVRRPAAGQPPIRHVLRHNGTNVDWSIAFLTGLSIVERTANRIVFDVPAAASANENPALVVRGASVWPDYRPGNPASSVNAANQRDGWACMELSLEADWIAGKIFHPRAIAELKDFSFGRTMDVQRINNSPVQTLAHRTHVGRCSYSSASTPYGWPLEIMVALFNETKVMPWLCMPHAASDEYQDWFWTYVRDNLNPTIPIVAEYSNEAGWNGQFAGQYGHCAAAGRALDPAYGGNHGYGWLAARMMVRAKAVFGTQAGRLHGAFVRQCSVPSSFTDAVIGVQAAGYALRDLFRIGSQAGYLDGGFENATNANSTPENRLRVMAIHAAWMATGIDDASRTFSPAFASQMRHGTGLGLPNGSTLDQLKGYDIWLETFCRAQGLQHNMKYELQNFHATTIGLGAVNGGNVSHMLSQLANDPQISGIGTGSLMREQYDFFRDHGISGCCVLTPYGVVNMYGSWATKRDPFAANTNLWSFYSNEQANAKLVAFDLWMEGSTNITAGEPFERQLRSYGGVFPAGQITIRSGAPGVTLVNGRLSGQLSPGQYPMTFAVTDGTGRAVTLSVTLTAAIPTGFRYFRVTPKGNRGQGTPTSNNFYRLGCSEAVFLDGTTVIAPGNWTATSPSLYGGNAPGRVCDGSTINSFITEDGGSGRPGQFTIDTGPGGGYKPTAIRFYEPPEAPEYAMTGCGIEVSRDAATWTASADVAIGRLAYTGNYTTVSLSYPA